MRPISPRYLLQFTESAGYLDFARFGPPSYAVLDATARLSEQSAHAGPATVDELMRQEVRAKAAAARLCGSDTDHIVLQPHTSMGLLQAAFSVPGGTVLVSEAEFPANTYPWARAEQTGRVTVRRLRAGHVTPDAVAEALTDDVTVVSVSAVDFRTGYRADLAALRDVIGDRLFVVDGIQGFGVIEAPWEVADVLVVGGQKWLRAGWGTGFTKLSDRMLERMDPVLSGWTGARDPGLFDNTIHPPESTAAAWSISNLSPVTSGAFAEALELVEDAGVAAIAARIAERVDALQDMLESLGATIVSATDRRAGILAFTLPGQPAEQVGIALNSAGIAATVRPEHVRLSPHASTSLDVVDEVRSALTALARARTATPAPPSASGPATHELLTSLVPAVHGLAAMLGPGNEVLLHDLSRLPDSIVAIAGDLTGRTVGGPMTDLLLGLIRRGTTQDLINYRTNSPDGRPIRSSTLFLRDADGVAVGCLCVNSAMAETVAADAPEQPETFPRDIDSLQRFLIDRAIAKVGVPPAEMKKQHKAAVVRELDEAGFFLIRDSVEHVAGQLDVTRYTIYNYLTEVRG
ncbi:aminotransferase class V-fold PLP-dependent enzyme [Mycolicibacterium smegmatis]|uniref:aminotransferase class V-fold PLP-dependent enzyme n=1 Tax=Mycolicibacterium smegmatis TaxID=1772 RepID=UPI0005D8EA8D|nr:aminotransferase class V-fold PLP-dependent enzyme [Mycolicibacterium smegmatis]MDF1902541.1 aminotransferase class V-fold PLP-dependent enzyme [Mycolicibacterium smegmatis]MDF1909584.1 aminotransferase class V-fold PLP-dependent enzyme [Mycolicibacterium smegmatis]MDF1919468.1 aminotransferase class V-fold PLP-dependent enzyme [Mycolicibacterium smegmatis]MDF1927976.1 aminotransferase class V-fold PLP-dependent enzyme [Mycolicibacterium smegmatis]UAK57954.1 aminotransferase class V-fold PL